LTLLELVIVLTILVALAGLVVPMVSNLLPFSSSSAGATNAAEIERVVQVCLTRPQYNSLGQIDTLDLLDNITAASLITATSLPPQQGGGFVPNNYNATPPDVSVGTLNMTTQIVNSLAALGIQNVYPLAENPSPGTSTPWNPTFYPYALNYSSGTLLPPTSMALSGVNSVAQLNSTVAAQKFGVSISGTYVVFGLGKYSAMSGTNGNARYLQEAPVAYYPSMNSGPDTVYCRFGLVFQVDPVAGNPATFVGAVEFEPTGVMTRDDNLTINGQAQ
jgi:hypothetical protein